MKIKKLIYIIIGCIGLGLGALGAALPLLPSFRSCFWRRFASEKARNGCTNGLSEQSCIKTTLKATSRAEA